MRLGIICPSEIASRRFMPALAQCSEISFAGVGVYTAEERFGSSGIERDMIEKALSKARSKAQIFVDQYGGRIFDGYESTAVSPEIDALYIPLPPALHFKWAKLALEHGKHVLIEKPATISVAETKKLVQIAESNNLALHENYMFAFHNQIKAIDEIVRSGEIGEVRLYRVCFGFPMRAANDFRYDRALGGGALIDAGGYTIGYAAHLLGPTATVRYAQSNYIEGLDVDIYGSAALVNTDGVTAQIAFGMDNNYKCELEVWGSKGCLTTGRVLTAPAGFTPTAVIRKGSADTTIELPVDDAFLKSIQHFEKCIADTTVRKERYTMIVRQAELVEEFKRLAGWDGYTA